jgi:hypothetical protein
MIGRRIGSWTLERELGRGGMGAVFLGRHAKLGTPAAVKALTHLPGADPSLQQRFEREAEVHAGLRHPHIAQVHDFVEVDGTWFLVMEYLPGGSLEDKKAAETTVPQAVSWVRQALAGLGYAHAQGVVHRDVKPGNLMLDEHGRVKVSDFGIARRDAGVGLTCTGDTLGTVQYMSPEQLEASGTVDGRTDLYAAGAVLYELLAGRPPFLGETATQVLRARLVDASPPSLSTLRPDLGPRLAEVVDRALAPDPAARFGKAEELRKALAPFEDASEGKTETVPVGGTVLWKAPAAVSAASTPERSFNPARRRRTAIASAVLVASLAVAGGGAYLYTQRDSDAYTRHQEEQKEHKQELVDQARAYADQAVAASGEAQEASERAHKEAAAARGALGRVKGARDPASATRAAEDAAQAAKSSGKAATSARDAAKRSGESASSARELATQVHTLTARRATPLQGLLVLAVVPPTGTSGDDGYGAQADAAARRAAEAANQARSYAEKAGSDAMDAQEAAGQASAALGHIPSGTLGSATGMGKGFHGRPPGPQLPPVPPDQPAVAIVAPGDPAFGAPLEEVLGQRLRRAGFDVRDPRASPAVDKLLRERGANVDQEALGRLLVKDGFNVLIVAPVEIAEKRTLEVQGQKGTLSLGQVRLNAYLLTTGGHLGRGWRERVEYTELDAETKAEQALIGATPELVKAIRKGWSGYRDQVAALREGRR